MQDKMNANDRIAMMIGRLVIQNETFVDQVQQQASLLAQFHKDKDGPGPEQQPAPARTGKKINARAIDP